MPLQLELSIPLTMGQVFTGTPGSAGDDPVVLAHQWYTAFHFYIAAGATVRLYMEHKLMGSIFVYPSFMFSDQSFIAKTQVTLSNTDGPVGRFADVYDCTNPDGVNTKLMYVVFYTMGTDEIPVTPPGGTFKGVFLTKGAATNARDILTRGDKGLGMQNAEIDNSMAQGEMTRYLFENYSSPALFEYGENFSVQTLFMAGKMTKMPMRFSIFVYDPINSLWCLMEYAIIYTTLSYPFPVIGTMIDLPTILVATNGIYVTPPTAWSQVRYYFKIDSFLGGTLR